MLVGPSGYHTSNSGFESRSQTRVDVNVNPGGGAPGQPGPASCCYAANLAG